MHTRPLFGFLTVASLYIAFQACSPPRPLENSPLSEDDSIEVVNNDVSNEGGASAQDDPAEPKHIEGGSSGALNQDSTNDPETNLSQCDRGLPADLSFSKKNLLTSAGQCAALRYCEFAEQAQALASAAAQYTRGPNEERKVLLQDSYLEAIRLWSRAELFQFGPAASSMADPVGGQGERDVIYSWPFVSRCRVEEQLFGQAYDEYGFDDLVQVPINARGLFALEYLSYYDEADTACSQFSITNADDGWSNISPKDLRQLKLSYLKAVANNVAEVGDRLWRSWHPEHGNYLEKFSNADGYMNQQEALNLMAHSLLYLEVEVKDYKLGAPSGLYQDAPLERPESSFSREATVLIQQNLRGFRDLFAGCGKTGIGFDDWLIAAGHEDLSVDILTELSNAEQLAKDFVEINSASEVELLQLHAAVKRVTDLLKGDFFGQGSPLGLSLPSAVEGDTD